MRDPDRIEPFLAAFAEVWKRNPDMRFGQLVMNLTRDSNMRFRDSWEWEDDYWLKLFEAYPSADELEAQTEGRLQEALQIMHSQGPEAAINHLFGLKEEEHGKS